jgi:pyrroloquinoline quinone biosynthesis protein D
MAQPHNPTANPVVLREKSGDRVAASDPDTAHAAGLTSGNLDSTTCCVLRDEALIEDFEDGSLVLLCEQLRLVQINPIARDVVGRLDGQRTMRQVAAAIAEGYDRPLQPVLADVLELLADLESQGVVERRSAGHTEALSSHPSTGAG